jgi:hypothetical protein
MALGCAAAAALLVSGGAFAIAGQGSGTLSACVHRKGGALYEAKKCTRHDSRLTWSISGPQGPAGPAGPAGSPGANGTNGTNGSNGIGATETRFNVGQSGTSFALGSLGSAGSLYGVCVDDASNIDIYLGVKPEAGLMQISGAYDVFDTVGNGATVLTSGGSAATHTWAISDGLNITSGVAGSGHVFMADAGPKAGGLALFSGEANVALGGGTSTAADYELRFDIYTVSGSSDSCQGDVTVYPV